jgi:hypothetical protein
MKVKDITEGVGRITKQNQTVDVGPDEVTKQAAKFGNKVDKDGRPPTLSKKVKGSSTNVAFNLGMVEGKQIPNPKNTFLSKSDTAYDFIRVGKSISNLSNAKKSDNRDEPDVMIVPFGGKKEKDHLKKGLKKAGYKTQDADKPGDDAQVDENFADGKKKGKSRPGRVKKSGASCNGSVTALRKRAKNASGEKAKMYHWCANMKSGRKKK